MVSMTIKYPFLLATSLIKHLFLSSSFSSTSNEMISFQYLVRTKTWISWSSLARGDVGCLSEASVWSQQGFPHKYNLNTKTNTYTTEIQIQQKINGFEVQIRAKVEIKCQIKNSKNFPCVQSFDLDTNLCFDFHKRNLMWKLCCGPERVLVALIFAFILAGPWPLSCEILKSDILNNRYTPKRHCYPAIVPLPAT